MNITISKGSAYLICIVTVIVLLTGVIRGSTVDMVFALAVAYLSTFVVIIVDMVVRKGGI